jgi:hypothetical protein
VRWLVGIGSGASYRVANFGASCELAKIGAGRRYSKSSPVEWPGD